MLLDKVLVDGVYLTAAVVVYYRTDPRSMAVIKQATACNSSGGAATVTVYLVPPGGSPAGSNAILWQKPIAAGATANLYQMIDHALAVNGASIQALASAGNAISFRVSGYERPGSS